MAALTPPIGQLGSSHHQSFDSSSTLNGTHDFLGPYFQSRRVSSESSTMALTPLSSTSRQPSSARYQNAVSLPPTPKRLRSQYPPDPTQSHVEFILVASFDIDRGSIMEHQYPGSITGDEHMLAELMLPDQVHNRSQDWTIFFLHKDAGADEDEEEQSSLRRRRQRKRRRAARNAGDEGNENYENLPEDDEASLIGSSEDEDDEDQSIEGPPLIYVLNLVNTKHDSSVKRGAIVKAMAICTRHPFLHIYKPLLLLALDEYFKAPNPGTLASLYDAVNAMDLSLMPRLSLLERNILQATASKDMFIEKFKRMIDQKRAEEGRHEAESPQKPIADGSSTPTVQYALPRDTHDFESRIVYNGISVPVKIPTTRSPEIVGDFSIIKLIQTFSAPHSQSAQAFTQHPHLTTAGQYTHPIIVLVNALLTQKRIMFLGHNLPSGDVAEAVLASCALASGGVLRGFTRHAFPYTDLTKIDDLLKVPGFIAGVTNPAFANKPEWWDLLCDLTTGRMKISSRIEAPQTTEGILSFQQQNPSALNPTNLQALQIQDATGDMSFMESVLRNITNRLGENAIRSMWRDWILKIIRISAAFEEAVYGASALYIGGEEADAGAFGIRGHGYVWSDEASRQRELAANVNRIEGWRNTRSYYSLIQDLANLYTSRPISSIDLHHHHDRLRSQKLSQEESAAIYIAFASAIQSPSEICQLLTVTSESHGGLFYISLGLVHPKREVRFQTAALLDRIMKHEAGRHYWESLGRFAKVAFIRIKRELDGQANGTGEDDGIGRATSLMEHASFSS